MVSFNLKVLAKLLAKIRWVLACSCSQNFCNCLSNARAHKNKHSAHMLVDARKYHSIPLLSVTKELDKVMFVLIT